MLNPTSTSAASTTPQSINGEFIIDRGEPQAVRDLRNPKSTTGTFLEEAERLMLLARLGVDIETLEEVEAAIEELEKKGDLSQSEEEELASLLEQREELFREASRRQNGETLPPGSMLSVQA